MSIAQKIAVLFGGFRSPNLLPNSRWIGAGPPTSWSSLFGTGTAAANGEINGNTIYRFTASATRPALAKPGGVALGTSGSLTLSVYVDAVYSGSDQINDLVGWASLPAGATATAYSVNGASAPSTTVAVAGMRVGLTVTSGGTAGTPIPRVGPGCSGAATVDIDLSRPQVNADARPSRYNAT